MKLRNLEWLPVYGIYLVMFFLAAESKLASKGVPEWFAKQFTGTALDIFPGSVTAQFYMIAAFETLVVLGLLTSLVRGEYLQGRPKPVLRGSLLFASVIFVMLSVGLRLTGDFNTASQVFIYFAVTWALARMDVVKSQA